MSAALDPYAPLWGALQARIRTFDPADMRRLAGEGGIVLVSSIAPGDTPAVLQDDPDHEEDDGDGGTLGTFATFPELRPHLPKDGRLRAVATAGWLLHRHQVREVDIATLDVGPVVDVIAFGGMAQ